MGSLPSLRFISQPEWGLGVDAKLRFGGGFNCFFAAESYFGGRSVVAFGLEPRRYPWVRLQFTPCAKVILRAPMARCTRYKYVYAGVEAALYDGGVFPTIDTTSRKAVWNSFRGLWRPVVEVVHRNTVFGVLLDDQQRKLIGEKIREVQARVRENKKAQDEARRRMLSSFDSPELPPLDPRRDPAEFKRMMIERALQRREERRLLEERRLEGEGPAYFDDVRLPKPTARPSMAPADMDGDRRTPGFVLAAFNGTHVYHRAIN